MDQSSVIKSVLSAILSLLLISPLASGVAAAVTVTGESVSDVTVEIENAPVADVLESLRERFGFELDGTEKAAASDALTVKLNGSLTEVLGRLLRNWNYVIVSSPDGSEQVEKVVILNASVGVPPSMSAKEESKDESLKQITGE